MGLTANTIPATIPQLDQLQPNRHRLPLLLYLLHLLLALAVQHLLQRPTVAATQPLSSSMTKILPMT